MTAATALDLSPTAYVGTAALAAACATPMPEFPVREEFTELLQARTALVRIAAAANGLAARALAGGEVTAAELAAAVEETARSVARSADASRTIHRRLA